jgi:antirestriction protein ArdC
MKKAKRDIYQEVTDKIITAMEAGTAPWRKSWVVNGVGGMPLRFNGKSYRGINVLILSLAGRANPNWMTYKQAKALGGNVRKGETGTGITFFKPLEITDKVTGDPKTIALLRGYTVFNVEQIDGLPERFYPKTDAAPDRNKDERIAEVETYIKATGATIGHGGGRAYYRPGTDSIQLPDFVDFDNAVAYYGTALHELVHWTGAEKRLDRNLKNTDLGKDYAREELVAELGAAFATASLGIENTPREDHASYLTSWLKVLKEDKKAIFKASALAQKAVDHLDSLQPVEEKVAA